VAASETEGKKALPLPNPLTKALDAEDKPMTLVGHLEELRWRIIWSVLYWAAGVYAAYQLIPRLLAWCRPLLGGHKLIFTNPTEAFFAYLNAALVLGACFASPVFLYHILMFVMPGLERHERRWVTRLLPFSILLFLLGCAFALYLVLPTTLKFFLSFATPELEAQLKIGDFVGFIVTLTVVCGVIFELPIVLLFLAGLGIVSSQFLSQHRRPAYFLAFVLAAVATPTPDIFTMSVVAMPILLNYEGSLFLIRMLGK
jgi:sec-independent protein translocase protein TatC